MDANIKLYNIRGTKTYTNSSRPNISSRLVCGDWGCISAKKKQEALKNSSHISFFGGEFSAENNKKH